MTYCDRSAMPNVQNSATATDRWLSNGRTIIDFHVSVKTEGAKSVGSNDLFGVILSASIALRRVWATVCQ